MVHAAGLGGVRFRWSLCLARTVTVTVESRPRTRVVSPAVIARIHRYAADLRAGPEVENGLTILLVSSSFIVVSIAVGPQARLRSKFELYQALYGRLCSRNPVAIQWLYV